MTPNGAEREQVDGGGCVWHNQAQITLAAGQRLVREIAYTSTGGLMAEAMWPYFGSAAGLKALIWRFLEAWAAPEARVEKVASVMGKCGSESRCWQRYLTFSRWREKGDQGRSEASDLGG